MNNPCPVSNVGSAAAERSPIRRGLKFAVGMKRERLRHRSRTIPDQEGTEIGVPIDPWRGPRAAERSPIRRGLKYARPSDLEARDVAQQNDPRSGGD